MSRTWKKIKAHRALLIEVNNGRFIIAGIIFKNGKYHVERPDSKGAFVEGNTSFQYEFEAEAHIEQNANNWIKEKKIIS